MSLISRPRTKPGRAFLTFGLLLANLFLAILYIEILAEKPHDLFQIFCVGGVVGLSLWLPIMWVWEIIG
jgi:hypothetical protein